MRTVLAGSLADTPTLQQMLPKVPAWFPVKWVILVADRGLVGIDAA